MNRIVIIGPESTGKTTLCQQLAEKLRCEFVPEYARKYLDEINRTYTMEDVELIAQRQIELEQMYIDTRPKLLLQDTDLITILIWFEVGFNRVPDFVISHISRSKPDLYLLMDMDIPWEYDPQREHPHLRRELFELNKFYVQKSGVPFELISGTEENRLHCALEAIKKYFPEIKFN